MPIDLTPSDPLYVVPGAVRQVALFAEDGFNTRVFSETGRSFSSCLAEVDYYAAQLEHPEWVRGEVVFEYLGSLYRAWWDPRQSLDSIGIASTFFESDPRPRAILAASFVRKLLIDEDVPRELLAEVVAWAESRWRVVERDFSL